jgi:hypothetical protein
MGVNARPRDRSRDDIADSLHALFGEFTTESLRWPKQQHAEIARAAQQLRFAALLVRDGNYTVSEGIAWDIAARSLLYRLQARRVAIGDALVIP